MLITNQPEKIATICLSVSWIFLLIHVLLFGAGYWEAEYISRYGAIMVFLCITAEFNLNAFKTRVLKMKVESLTSQLDENSSIIFSKQALKDMEDNPDPCGKVAADLNATIVIGTIIWAYGDKIAEFIGSSLCKFLT